MRSVIYSYILYRAPLKVLSVNRKGPVYTEETNKHVIWFVINSYRTTNQKAAKKTNNKTNMGSALKSQSGGSTACDVPVTRWLSVCRLPPFAAVTWDQNKVKNTHFSWMQRMKAFQNVKRKKKKKQLN